MNIEDIPDDEQAQQEYDPSRPEMSNIPYLVEQLLNHKTEELMNINQSEINESLNRIRKRERWRTRWNLIIEQMNEADAHYMKFINEFTGDMIMDEFALPEEEEEYSEDEDD